MTTFPRVDAPEKLHTRVTRTLALQILKAERAGQPLVLPNEADLCQQLGVSRSILREAVKVLAGKGMVEVRPRLGTRARARTEWNQLDPDILNWWTELGGHTQFLRELCEVRLAIEPTAAGFAAVRGTPEEIDAIAHAIEERKEQLKAGNLDQAIDLELHIHSAVLTASHSPLLEQLSRAIRQPLRLAIAYTAGLRTAETIETAANQQLLEAFRRHDAMLARTAAEKIVGLAMLSLEDSMRRSGSGRRGGAAQCPES